jgi:hypothetical protein
MARNRKRNSKANAICDRTGFKYPINEMLLEDGGLLVHKSVADGKWSQLLHPLNNLGRYLKGKSGDPFPVENARFDRDWEELTTFSGQFLVGASFNLISNGRVIRRGGVNIVAEATMSALAYKIKLGSSAISASASLVTAGHPVSRGAAAISGTGSITVSGSWKSYASSAIVGSAVMTVFGRKASDSAVFMEAFATISSNGTGRYKGATSITGNATLTASIGLPGAASISGSATMTAVNGYKASGATAIIGSGTITVSGMEGYKGATAIPGTGASTFAGHVVSHGATAISGTATTAANGYAVKKGATAISGTGSMTSDGTEVSAFPMVNGLLVTDAAPRTVPSNVHTIAVEGWGGGGQGGRGGSGDFYAGGGSGGYVKRNAKSVIPGSLIAATIGSGGNGTLSVPDAGDNGTSTVVDGMTAGGGSGGNDSTGGSGGSATGGNVNTSGASGSSSSPNFVGGNAPNGGLGGATQGTAGAVPGGGGAGGNGVASGAGGSGAVKYSWTGWDISESVYASKFLSIGGQDTDPVDITANSDGTKVYVVGNTGNAIYQYNLSTAWDLSTAAYSTSFSVSGQTTSPSGMHFNADGFRFFLVGSNRVVYQYNLSTAWDLSTASYGSVSFSIVSQCISPQGISLKSDGTKFFIVENDNANSAVFQYSMSTPWDLSTASYDSVSKNVSAQTSGPGGINFKTDGATMYISNGIGQVWQYTLSTPWVVSSASYASKTFTMTSQDSNMCSLVLKTDGTIMFTVGRNNDRIYEYSVGN